MKQNQSAYPLSGIPGALCLDAPAVALAWAWLLALEHGRKLSAGMALSLYLFVWLIYALDRYVQAFGVDAEEDTVRHRFWFTYKYILTFPVAAAVAGCVYVTFWILPRNFIFYSGLLVSGLAVYLFFCCFTTRLSLKFTPKVWLCGLLFALGVQLAAGFSHPDVQALSEHHDLTAVTGVQDLIGAMWSVGLDTLGLLLQGNTLLLGVGFAMNCAVISLWQQERNPHLPDRRSFAALGDRAMSHFVRFTIFWIGVLILTGGIALLLPPPENQAGSFTRLHPISLFCMAGTLLLLLFFNRVRNRFSVEELRLIADSVYLTPLLWMAL